MINPVEYRELRLRIAKLHTTLAWQEHSRELAGRLLSHSELRACYRRYRPYTESDKRKAPPWMHQ